MTRASRIAAGLVLIVGAIELAYNAVQIGENGHTTHGMWHAPAIIVATWLVAAVVALVGAFVPDRADGAGHVSSYVLPYMGVALMLPLTIHLPFAIALGGTEGFDWWVLYSTAFVGIAHIVFAILVGLRASALAKGTQPISVRQIYVGTVVASGMPGLLVVIPVLLVAMTAALLLPMLHAMEVHIQRVNGLPVARIA